MGLSDGAAMGVWDLSDDTAIGNPLLFDSNVNQCVIYAGMWVILHTSDISWFKVLHYIRVKVDLSFYETMIRIVSLNNSCCCVADLWTSR